MVVTSTTRATRSAMEYCSWFGPTSWSKKACLSALMSVRRRS